MLRKVFSSSLLVFGVIGLLVSLLGEFTSLGEYKSAPPRSWEKFDPQLVKETPDLASLHRKVNALTNQPTNQPTTEQEKMLIIYDVVIRRFTHSDQAKYNLFSNWFLWLLGEVHSPSIYIIEPSMLVKKGYSGLCSQQAYLLQVLAGANGIHNRTVGLNGHVVMEAWYDNDWHLFDPDLEVFPMLDNKRILSLDDLAKSSTLLKKYYHGTDREKFIGIISSRKDNSFSTAYPKPTMNLYIEYMGDFFKWFIPLILLFLGCLFFFKGDKK